MSLARGVQAGFSWSFGTFVLRLLELTLEIELWIWFQTSKATCEY